VALEASSAMLYLLFEPLTIDADIGFPIPRFGRCLPAERAARPQRVQAVDHSFEQLAHRFAERIDERGEPGAMFAVLAFELAIKARIAWRPMQHQHLMLLEDLPDPRGIMRFRSIGSQDERRAIAFDVALERVHDEVCIVVFADSHGGAIRNRGIGADERVAFAAAGG